MQSVLSTQAIPKTPVFAKPGNGLTEVQGRIVKSTYKLRYVTIPHLARLHYNSTSPATLNYVASVVKTLDEEHKNYLQRGFLGQAVRFARNPSVLRLTTSGISHIASLGLTPLPKFRPSDPFPSFDKLAHTLYTNDVIIAAIRFAQDTPGYTLAEYRHDWMLHHTPIYVASEKKQQEKIAVIPDAWFDFRLPQPEGALRPPRLPVHLELDNGTEDTADSFKPKLHALLAYLDGPYEAFFHVASVTIAFATTKGNMRLLKMREWTEEVLRERNREQDGHVFYFTCLPHKTDPETGRETRELNLDPQQLFLSPVWLTPFDDTAKVLLSATV